MNLLILSCLLAVSCVVEPDGLTLSAALERIRSARAGGDSSPARIEVRGTNLLDRTLVFLPEDHDIDVVGAEGAALSGGRRLGGWRDAGDGVWEADLPRTAEGKPVFFDQLWVNGRRAPNARLPDEGYFWMAKPSSVAVSNDAGHVEKWIESVSLTNAEAKVLADVAPDALNAVSEHIVHWWSYARRQVRAVDRDGLRVTTWSPAPTPGWKVWREKETIVWYENVPTAFDAPGEWLWDGVNGKVRYRPLPGEDVRALSFVAPVAGLSRLVSFEGDYAKERLVRNVTFRDIAFCHTFGTRHPDLQLGKENPAAVKGQDPSGPVEMWQLQAACGSDGAVTLEGVRNVRFENCTFEHTGNYALRFNSGCVSNAVVSCRLTDIGAGGIWMGSRLDCQGKGSALVRKVLKPDRPDSTAFNLISNNAIVCIGRYNPEGTGVALTHCSDSRVIHNEIRDAYYTGISVGFTWGFNPSVAQRNEIAFNRISDLGKGVLSDMGGVYTLATSFGTTVHDNVIHDVWSLRYGGWALYCDEGSEGIVLERNLCWNTTDAGFHQHYGAGCAVRNNIFAFNRESGAVKTRRREVKGVPCSLHVVNNIVYVKNGELTGEGVTDVDGVWANNLWWDVRGRDAARFGKGGWDAWCASGKETGGRLEDPLFVDADKFDFRLRPDSPAPKLGFRPWDFTNAGRRP